MNIARLSKSIAKKGKLIVQVAVGLFSIVLGIYFIKHEQTELTQVKAVFLKANAWLMALGILLVFLFIVVQGLMYRYSFKAVQKNVPLKTCILLYLKRNFISVFVPAGMVTNMFFFNREIEEKEGIDKTLIYYASTLFYICSILSSVLIAIPAISLLFLKGGLQGNMIWGLLVTVLIISLLVYATISIFHKGAVYRFLKKKVPSVAKTLEELSAYPIEKAQVVKVLGFSLIIETIGVAHLYIAMMALGFAQSLPVAIIGYSLMLIILLGSPFLRGIGAIELALTYALTLFGYSAVAALSVVFLFRFFEFWSVLVLGLFAILLKKDGLFLQLLAPVLLFFLGIVNLLSALSPALVSRVQVLRDFIPYDVMEVSNTAVLLIGVILMFTSMTLLRGFKNAYYLAVALTLLSFIGHLFKGIDYEEAALALFTAGVLLFQRKSFYVRSAPVSHQRWQNGLIFMASVLLYGIIGFYFLDKRHFNEDFTLDAAIWSTVKSFSLLNTGLEPLTTFGRYFLLSLNILGVASVLFLLYLIIHTFRKTDAVDENQFAKAKQLVSDFGNSSMDYFKTYPDKHFYFFEDDEGFISYKSTDRYAVVLGNPVCSNPSPEQLSEHIRDFEVFALTKNRNAIYYRVPEAFKEIYANLGKKMLLIGEDAVVDLKNFTLEGGGAKALRNAINKMNKEGFVFKVNPAPQNDGFLQQLAFVSNDWLQDMQRGELCFSQGVFSFSELKNQTILTIGNNESKIVAFLNLIPSIKGELNFDLMRKTADAPHGTMDFLFASMMQHYKYEGYGSVNLGMVPLSGIDDPENIPERAMKLAYEKMSQFGHYKSLRFFKEKFNPYWIKMYIAYDSDLDLVNLTAILNRVMKTHTDTI